MIDPTPAGWMYGFPKPVPRDIVPETLEAWLLENGYPKDLLEICRYRFFEVED